MSDINLLKFIKDNLTLEKYSRFRFFALKDKYRVWKYTFEEIYFAALHFSLYLKDKGISENDKVIIKGRNSPEWVISFISILLCDAVVVPLDIKTTSDFDQKVFNKVKAKAVILDDIDKQETEGFFSKADVLKFYFDQINYLSGKSIFSNFSVSSNADNNYKILDNYKIYNFKNSLSKSSQHPIKSFINKDINNDINGNAQSEYEQFEQLEESKERLAEIIFTSGTTSEPKGVMITYKNIEANLKAIIPVMQKYNKIFRFMINPKILSVVPLSHMYGQLIGIFTPLMLKSSVIFTQKISPSHILNIIKEQKIWILGTLPKILEMIKDYLINNYKLDDYKFINKYNKLKNKKWQLRFLSFLNLHFKIGFRLVAIMVGGAALDPSVEEFFRTISYSIFQGYGLTETAPLITLSDPIGGAAGSIGKVLPGQEIKIINNEVYVRGDNVSAGYFEDYEQTKKSFIDGWFKTGDLVEIDKNGNVYFKGRKDDVIVRPDGLNIYPKDIEVVLKSYPDVKDCAVVAIKQNGKISLIAVLILKSNAKSNAEKIIQNANKKLNVYQKLSGYFLWQYEDFPRTPTMKVKKNILVDNIIKSGYLKQKISNYEQRGYDYTTAIIGDKIKSTHKDTSIIVSLISKVKKIPINNINKIKSNAKLEEDIGLDSLDLIELTSRIEEKYNIKIDDTLLTRETTLEQLENIISKPQKEAAKIPFYNFPYWFVVRILRTAFQYFLYPFISMLYIKKVIGKEIFKKIKEYKGPVVFAANHTSNLDAFVILYSLPLWIRMKVTALMSIEHHFYHFFYKKGPKILRLIEALGFYLLVNLAVNATPLSRTHGFVQTLENVGKLLDRGFNILIFPEGGVTTDGQIKKFESGIGIIAVDMKVPIVPVKIEGLYNILRNGILPWGHLPKLPKVKVIFGEPLLFNKKNYLQVAKELEEIIKYKL